MKTDYQNQTPWKPDSPWTILVLREVPTHRAIHGGQDIFDASIDIVEVLRLGLGGQSWPQIARSTGLGQGTVYRAYGT